MAKKAPKKTATTKTAAKKTTSKKAAVNNEAPEAAESAAVENEPAAEETSILLRKFKSSWQPESTYKVETSSGKIPDAPPFTEDANAKKLLLLKFDISTFPTELTPENQKKQDEAIKRIAEEKEKRKAEFEAMKKAAEEAAKKAEEEARLKAEEEARLKAEEEARIKAEEEARLKAEEEARLKAEEEARIKAEEEARIKAEEEARKKAEEEARKKAEEEARLKAEEEARLKAEEEARLKAEEEARIKAEAEARVAAAAKAVEIAREEARRRYEEAEKAAPKKKPSASIKKEAGIGPGALAAGVIFGLLLTVLFFKSAINSTNYYVKTSSDGIQIWQGDFSPKGASMIADLKGVKNPEKIEACYSKNEVAPIIFSYYIGLAEKQLKMQEIKLARTNAENALEYAVDSASQKAAEKCISQVNFMELLEKADIKIAEASQESIQEAIGMMVKTPKYNIEDSQLVILENKISVAKAQLAELKRISSSKLMPAVKKEAKAVTPAKPQEKKAEAKADEPKANHEQPKAH